jgi:hypothetical protein
MSMQQVSLALGVLGATLFLASWIGRRTGDAARDTALMVAIGTATSAVSGVLYLSA